MGQGSSGQDIEDRYFLQKVKLGQGSFGVVWRAVDRQTNTIVAVKQLDKVKMPIRGVRREDIQREVHMMQAARHVNIIQLHATFEDARAIYLALEYCDGGDFGDKVRERGMNIEESEAAVLMRQILAAIAELHSKSICHRDIKPDNFMVQGDSFLKLSDFGLALSLPRGKLLTEKCGTPAFMSPEQHRLPSKSPGYGLPIDMWAAGVSMYMIMFGGRHPFLDSSRTLDIQQLIAGGLDFSENHNAGFFGFGDGGKERYSGLCRALCTSLVTADPSLRMTADDAMRHAWVNPDRQSHRSRSRLDEESLPQSQGLLAQQESSRAEVPQAPLEKQLTGLQGVQDQLLRVFAGSSSTASAAASGNGGGLQTRLKCRYFSDSQDSWIPATVQGYNGNSTYNLDVKPYAVTSKISPRADVIAQDAWPPGTWVLYESSSVSSWIASSIISFNEGDGTYNLECRDHAAVDKIRPRTEADAGSVGGSVVQGMAQVSPAALSQSLGRTSLRRTDHSVTAAAGDQDYRDGSQEHPFMVQDLLGPRQAAPDYPAAKPGFIVPPDANVQRPPPVRLEDLPEVFCTIADPKDMSLPQRSMAIVESFHECDGTCTVLPVPPATQERQTVRVDSMRPPRSNDTRHAWPAGTKVEYHSPSLAQWIPALVFSFNCEDGTYVLDVRDHAASDRIRPHIPS